MKNGDVIVIDGRRWKIRTTQNIDGYVVGRLEHVEGENYDTWSRDEREEQAKRPPWVPA